MVLSTYLALMCAAWAPFARWSAPSSSIDARAAVQRRPLPLASRRAAEPRACGILAVSNSQRSLDVLKLETLTLQRLVRHRGPDGSGIHVIENADGTTSSLAHERLANGLFGVNDFVTKVDILVLRTGTSLVQKCYDSPTSAL